MSDLESFSFESANQSNSAETFRLFQDRMKVAAAQIQAIRAGEQKQKKKEDELAKILSDFIKSHQNDQQFSEFIVHITKLLALNLPAVFILSFLLLNFPEMQSKTNIPMLSLPEAMQAYALDGQTLPDLYLKNHQLPPYHKIAIDNWIQTISITAADCRPKLLTTALAHPPKLSSSVAPVAKDGHAKDGLPLLPTHHFRPQIADFMTFSLSIYLQTSDYPIAPQFLQKFSEFCLQGILNELQKPIQQLDKPAENS